MTDLQSRSSQADPKVLAAVMGAVQAYVDEEEANAHTQEPLPPSRAWRLAAWLPTADIQLGRHRSWTGRG